MYDAPGFGIPGTFFLFAAIVLMGTIFFNYFMVETAGVPLEETDEVFAEYKAHFDKQSLKWTKHN
ncbi:MAG: uncharacterized protein KVP18_003313 [Porospora cf. gigantea A]|uniref:uncharacterized protein n=1 Tax=Porospora cf. gigantea A TaxID=2853593 RepID=UPI003559F8FD|nr:MAG: hypothetical protein KVP18_003313 [Porospora cf. gigantea A]